MEVDDIASSTHPSSAARPTQNPHASLIGLKHPRFMETPSKVIGDELQCLVREECPLREKQFILRYSIQESSPFYDGIFRQPMMMEFKLPNM